MEQLNQVHLRGYIGSIKVQTVGCSKVARFTVATNYAFRDAQGYCVRETTWSNVVAWEGNSIYDLDSLKKGDAVEIIGRLKNQRYTSVDGTEHSSVEILAHTVRVITEPLKMEGKEADVSFFSSIFP